MKVANFEVPHYVTGHRVPDTDSLVSAYVLAWYFRESKQCLQAKAVRLGEPGAQASWLFKEAQLPIPPLLADCRYTVGHVLRKVEPVNPETSLGKVLERIHGGSTDAVPVVRDGKLVGIVSDRSPKTNYFIQCNVEDMMGTLLTLSDLVHGLDLVQVSAGENRPSPDRLIFLAWEPGTSESLQFKDALVIAGHQPEAIRSAILGGASGIITVGGFHPDGELLELARDVPFFTYKGSMGSLAARLTGSFRSSEAMEESFPVLDPDQSVSTVRQSFGKAPYSLPVVDEKNNYLGMLSAADVLSLPSVRVSLVDHFERSQTIRGIEEATIQEIVDHHRIGDIESIQPLRVDCRPLGSTATILFDRCREKGLELPPEIALLLLGAIISDTLMLNSPTTTTEDREACRLLAEISGRELKAFGMEVLRQNDRLMLDQPAELVRRDCKAFQHGKFRFLAAQIETVDLSALSEGKENELKEAFLSECRMEAGQFGALMITDVFKQVSRIILVDCSGFPIHNLLPDDAKADSGAWVACGWVSRKKQLIPYLMNKLEENGPS